MNLPAPISRCSGPRPFGQQPGSVDKLHRRFRARVRVAGKQIYLGLFLTEPSARKAIRDYLASKGAEDAKALQRP
jgi:hypothetical protein